MPDNVSNPARPPWWRRAMKTLTRLAAYSSAALLAAGSIGQVTRDRSVPLALLMYIPLLPLGAVAVAADLAFRGRSLPRLRFGLTVVGLVAMAWSAHEMIGAGHSSEPARAISKCRCCTGTSSGVAGLFRGLRTWTAQREAILARKPDLVVLSEAPPGDWLDRLVADLGPGASSRRNVPRPEEPLLVSNGGLLSMAAPTREATSRSPGARA